MTDIAILTSGTGRTSDTGLDTIARNVRDTGAGALRTAARVTYTTTYVLAYGAVFLTLLVAKSIPRENPIMHGLADGGRAAKDVVKSV